jgi:hypothetical protein
MFFAALKQRFRRYFEPEAIANLDCMDLTALNDALVDGCMDFWNISDPNRDETGLTKETKKGAQFAQTENSERR